MSNPGKPHRLAPCCRQAIEGDRTLRLVEQAEANCPPWDNELERNTLGLALIGDQAVPAWLEPRHFFSMHHAEIFRAIQAAGGHLVKVAQYIRTLDNPPATSHQLAVLVDEAVYAAECGWHFDFERLRELARQRDLLETMARVAILLRAGEIDYAGAVGALRDCVRSK